MSEDWSISPPLPDKVFPWEKYNPVTREEVNEFFHSPEILVIKERMCDIGRRLWNREYVDGNGGNISVRVAQNLLLCSPTLCSKGFMTVEDICMVDMDARQKAGIRPSTSEVKTHIAMMKSVGVNACIHAHPPHCNAFLFAGQVPPPASIRKRISSWGTSRWPLTERPALWKRPGPWRKQPDNPPSFSWKTTESLPEHVTWKKRNGSWKMRMPTAAWC